MQNIDLYEKYKNGRHWENHPTIYAEDFSNFLKKINFKELIVDIGCGNGRDIHVFSKHGFLVQGIDISEEEIILAKQNSPKLHFRIGDVENLNFQDESVGAFFMINVIHYVNKKKSINEIFRSLKSGGYLFIHFNLEIKDKAGNVDYEDSEKNILNLVSDFRIINKKIFERTDKNPFEHKHKILQLILQK